MIAVTDEKPAETGLPHDVRVECDHRNCKLHGEWREWVCRYWRDDGYRTVKGLVDVVPVVGVGDRSERPKRYIYLPGDSSNSVLLATGSTDPFFEILTPAHVEALGPIEPGMFAILFTEKP